ncbi:MAG TPA: DUF6600 domain-containing protein [Steroidobacteraceae bacterium]|nr:DUF6600 domain-containing protein [Steroidobacteraceae bacterium]
MMRLGSTALVLLLAASGPALALEADPPSRVARLSYIDGQVLLQAADAGAPEQAALNLPVTIGDRVTTESGSRAELSVGTAALRLDEYTDLTVANLDSDIAQVSLNSGTLGIHVRELLASETFEVDTPNATIRLLRPGDYRIGIDQDGAAVVAVRSGDAEIDNGNGPVRLRDGQQLRLANGDQFANVQNLDPQDAFDTWCIDRERAISDAQSSRYVSRDVVGYEDLDQYGNWYSEPGYGAVWAPTVVIAGWAPYSYGRWAWISPWGWTWVDRSPWGFAPFHYGRWAFMHQRWCWVPGPRFHRPVWAPGLVAWHRGSDRGDPRNRPVSWFPLGPREVYVPSKQVSPRYLRNVNVANTAITNNAYITNVYNNRVRDIRYINRNAPSAVTTVPRSAFTAAGPVTRPAWSGDFRDNARMQPAPAQRHVNDNPRMNRGADPRLSRGADPRMNRGADSRVADASTPAEFGRPQRTERPQADGGGEGRMTIPRTPTDRRQIQSDDGWRRIDSRPNTLQPTIRGAPVARFDANRGVSNPAGRAASQPTFNRGPGRSVSVTPPQGNGAHENRGAAGRSTTQPAGNAHSAGNSRGATPMGGGRSNRGGLSVSRQ